MTELRGDAKPAYSISLHVSKQVKPHTVKEGNYDTRAFPGETVELARVKLTGDDLAALLTKAEDHIKLVDRSG